MPRPTRRAALARAAAQASAIYDCAIAEAKQHGRWDRNRPTAKRAERAQRRLVRLVRWYDSHPEPAPNDWRGILMDARPTMEE